MIARTNRATILLASERCGGMTPMTGMLESVGRTDRGNLRAAFQYLQGVQKKGIERHFTRPYCDGTRGKGFELKESMFRL